MLPAVCQAVISGIDGLLTTADRKTPDAVEKVMQKYCETTKGKDKTMVRLPMENNAYRRMLCGRPHTAPSPFTCACVRSPSPMSH